MFSQSKAERSYLLEDVDQGIRLDGRNQFEYRPISLEVDVLPSASGSARLRLGETEVLVGVKVEVEDAAANTQEIVRLCFTVECSGSANIDLQGKGTELLNAELRKTLENANCFSNLFENESLAVYRGKLCWILQVDILVLDTGGNLLDAVSIATRAALAKTLIPKVHVQEGENGALELEIDDNPSACHKLDVCRVPVFISFCMVGKAFVLDPSLEEETCSEGKVFIAIEENGNICHFYCFGLLDAVEVTKLFVVARQTSKELFVRLGEYLQ
eukprot:jgi/Galph1/4973/GphlegSOOS_G3644.1